MKYPLIKSLLVLATALAGISSCTRKETTVTLGSLLEEMTDREAITRYPDPAYLTKQFSSYDRATISPDDKSWFANWDRSMFIGVDTIGGRKEYIMMDAEGPGAVTRFWMTFAGENSGKGILRFYLDDNPVPAIEGEAFGILSGGLLTGEPMSSSVSDISKYHVRGHNLYLPVPYAGRCKITYESDNIKDFGAKTGGEAVYYNINYRTYAPGTRVISYDTSEVEKYRDLMEQTNKKLAERNRELPDDCRTAEFNGRIIPGEQLGIEINEKKNAVRKLEIKISAKNREQALRSTILELEFDGNTTVKVPVGDFFGTGYQVRYVDTWYTNVEEDGTMSCRWVMPFKKNCKVSLVNTGSQEVTVEKAAVTTSPYKWDGNSMYFGSSWQQYTRLFTGEMKNNEGDGFPFDLNYVELKGKGVYAGDGIVLYNTVYAWWGEGDEKVYVDGESFPSQIGTGTEDYYGYAWCRPEKFSNHPFIAQPDGSGNFTPGYTVNLRYRGLDAIPFNTSLKFDMEMWHWTRAIINFAPVTHWYISPQDVSKNLFEPEGAREPVVIERHDLISPVIENGRIEGEHMMLKGNDEGGFRYSNNVKTGWSGNMQFIWTGEQPGAELFMAFISEEDKICDAAVKYTSGPQYGSFTVSINGSEPLRINAAGDDIKLNSVTIPGIKLKKGENELRIRRLGAVKGKKIDVGIDYIDFTP